jgi:hypothetical protein
MATVIEDYIERTLGWEDALVVVPVLAGDSMHGLLARPLRRRDDVSCIVFVCAIWWL